MADIDNAQWLNVTINLLGLRSGSSPNDFGPASYSMNNALSWRDPKPADWSDRLNATIELMLGFPNHEARYLMIVEPSAGNSFEYPACFPKCSSRPRSALTTVLIGRSTRDQLADWVVANIPARPARAAPPTRNKRKR